VLAGRLVIFSYFGGKCEQGVYIVGSFGALAMAQWKLRRELPGCTAWSLYLADGRISQKQMRDVGGEAVDLLNGF